MADTRLSIQKTTNGTLPRVPFLKIKNAILGSSYELSLVFVGDTRAQSLNQEYRKKGYVPDILSFPLDTTEGEIFINPHQAHRRAKDFDMNDTKFICYLFIHGLLHLKGVPHGSTMERMEQRYLKRFSP